MENLLNTLSVKPTIQNRSALAVDDKPQVIRVAFLFQMVPPLRQRP
nr:hypothetical protein [Psychrobacter sp. PraFG1]UNK06215.1 hypothetical protein MN210_06420 [Psychrobacter sp. PraFG1]